MRPTKTIVAPSPNTGLGTRSRHDLSMLSGDGKLTYNPSYVFALQITPDQSVWAATWGGGVSRFDGKHWRNFTTRDGLAGDIVYSIAQEPNGVLWFGTDGGVSRYDGKSWHNYNKKDRPAYKITSMRWRLHPTETSGPAPGAV